jgi:DNA-binding beta-propeller fold protein YncE
MKMRSFLFFISISSAAFAQLGGPVLGYLPQGSSLRLMYGLPAAGAIGSTINAGRDFAQIAISPSQAFAVVSAADTGEVMVFNPVTKSLTDIAGAGANPDMIAVSPSGTSAALWFPLLGHLQVVSGLPDSPTLRTMDASFLNASPLAIAVTDDGQWAAGLWSAGVYSFGPSSQVVPLQTDPGVIALAFFHNNHTLALATSARATSITDVGGANQTAVLDDYSAQILSPRAMAVSFDNQHAVIADVSGKIVNISVSTASAAIVDCECSPTGVYGLGSSVFRLNSAAGGARNALSRGAAGTELKVFDAAAGAVWIVPPALSETTGARQ